MRVGLKTTYSVATSFENFPLIGSPQNANVPTKWLMVGCAMRKSLGIGILAIGVAVLGFWAKAHNAHRIETFITERAADALTASVHGAMATVSGRDIHLSGIMDGKDEQTALMAALNGIDGRRVVTADVTVLDTVAPFTLQVIKGAALTASGFVPTEGTRADLAALLGESAGDTAVGLTLAAGAPVGWLELAKAGIASLGTMNSGEMSLSDGTLSISGEVTGPDEAAAVEAALAGLPAGTVTKNLTLLDDGTPAAYELTYAAATGASIAGKLPNGLDVTAIATALGLPAIAGTVTQGLLGKPSSAGIFAALKGVLGQLETLKISVKPDGGTVEATVQPGVDVQAISEPLASAMAGFDVSVAALAAQAENGAVRTNAATGAAERFMGNYWLSVPQIKVDLAGCQSAVNGVLAGDTINFVSGSDELDASAVQVINDLGAIIARCAEEAGLRAEIGGYTDRSGDALENLGLSQRRAVAVRRELIARGVQGSAVRSVGYGAANPVADNATEEGRAKNRRTTITWSQ